MGLDFGDGVQEGFRDQVPRAGSVVNALKACANIHEIS